MIASHGFDPHRIDLTAQGKGFPRFSSGKLRIVGNLNGAPVNADAALVHNGKLTMNGAVEWKSLHANGNFEFPVRAPATGKATVAVGQLADLSPFLVTGLKGTLTSSITLAPRGNVSVAGLHGQISNAEIAGTTIVSATATGTVTDPFGAPSLAFDLSAQKLILAGVTGDAKVKLSGPLRNVAIAADAKLEDLRGAPAHISANAGFNTEKRALVLDRMNAEWRGETAALAFPATVETANGVKIDQAVVRIGTGTVKLSGRITPALSAFVAMTSVDAQILQPFVPTPLRGSLSATAELSGTLSEPRGTFSAHAHSLVAQAYFPKTSMNIDAQGTLHGDGALLDATLSAGAAVRLTLKGDAPLRATAPMRLSVDGVADLTLLDPFLAAEGQRLRGTLAFDGDILGTLSSPRLSGGGTLKNGELQDYTRGIHVRSIDAAFKGEGQSLRITQLSARAGPGTISGNGQIDFSAPGTPLDIVLKIQKARPIVSDLVTAVVSGNVHISGTLERTLAVAGKLDVSRGTINIPDRFPPDVAVLDVRRKNSAEPPQPPGSASVALDLAVATSGPIFVRGRGIDADLGGSLHLGNTLAVPLATGGFDMNRGTVTLAGQTLTFTTGKLGFDGGSVRNSIDPSLNFVAQTTSGGVTATLTVTGHASKPQIVLSSAPSLPQDEVLAHLFFQQSAKQLTPLQLAQIAQAIASLGGVGSGFDPLGALRRNLRLDRLSIGSTSGGASGSEAQTTVEGGKYVARNVYVGAKQTLSGSTQVQVQVDLTKQLKAQATVSTGTNATSVTGNSAQNAGSSVGLSYEFEY
jgi:translocation and assembly module TamB